MVNEYTVYIYTVYSNGICHGDRKKKIKHNGDFTRTIWYKAGHLTVRFQKSVATVFVRTPKNSKRGAV
jgi:hypothetical protein